MTTLRLKAPPPLEQPTTDVALTPPRWPGKTPEEFVEDARAREATDVEEVIVHRHSPYEDFSFRSVPKSTIKRLVAFVHAHPDLTEVEISGQESTWYCRDEDPETFRLLRFHHVPRDKRILIHRLYGELLEELKRLKQAKKTNPTTDQSP